MTKANWWINQIISDRFHQQKKEIILKQNREITATSEAFEAKWKRYQMSQFREKKQH